MREAIWSCVLDDVPAIWDAFPLWVAGVMACGEVAHDAIIVHHAAPLRTDIARLCDKLRLETVAIEPFDPRSGHANKIVQCRTTFAKCQKIVLTDVDTVCIAPLPLRDVNMPVAGCTVDQPNPPLGVLEQVFDQAGITIPRPLIDGKSIGANSLPDAFETVQGNFNGGLYVLDPEIALDLGEAWAEWALWLLDDGPDLGRYAVHVDQIGFCMAVSQLGITPQALNKAWNWPMHIEVPQCQGVPLLLHHHGLASVSLEPLVKRSPQFADVIRRADAKISVFLKQLGLQE